jgi:peptide deformylase
MGLLKIFKYGEPVLRHKCKAVDAITPEIVALANDMLETMYLAPGVGLAANQVGVPVRLCVIDLRPEGKRSPMIFVNPSIEKHEGRIIEDEGCLSFPGFTVKAKRSRMVRVCAQDITGKQFTVNASNFLSRVLQHEIDHLDGNTFLDHISATDKKYVQSEIRRRKKEGIW